MRRALLLILATTSFACTSERAKPAPAEARTAASTLAKVRASDRALARFGASARAGLAHVGLPRTAAEPLRIGPLGDPSRALEVRPLGLAAVSPKVVEDALVFEDAAPATDVLVARQVDGAEEVRVLTDARAPTVFRWQLRAGDASHLVRLRDGVVETVDSKGKVIVRSGRFFAVDAKGVRRDVALALATDGDAWTLTASLATDGLVYPVVVDPVWLGGPSMSAPRSDHVAARAPDGKVWIACGNESAVDVFDETTDAFSSAGDLPESARDCAITFGADGKPRVLSGGKSFLFDATTKTWSAGPSTTHRESNRWVVLGDGKVLSIGGTDDMFMETSKIDVFDPATDGWSTTASTSTPRSSAAIAVLPSGKVLVAGGYDGSNTLSTVEIYDPVAKTWTAGPSLPGPRMDAATVVVSGKVLVVGGYASGGGKDATSAIFDPAGAGAWSAGPSISVARYGIAAVTTADGRVLVLGGTISGEGDSLQTVEVSDATLAAFKPTVNLVVPRAYSTATVLSGGRVLVAGGTIGFGSTTSTELLSSFVNGAACTWNGECASGFCASGVCCESACASECRRCDLAGSLGKCAPAPATKTCGSAPGCTGSSITGPGKCSGVDDTCVGATATPCAGGLVCADATSCLAKCTKDDDCVQKRCDVATGLCLPAAGDAGVAPVAPQPEGSPKVLGTAQPCTSPSECATGFCVDGVCCDSACTDRCHSCALPSAPGRCTEEPLGVDLRNECGAALSCAGTCGKGGVCTTSVAGSQCAPSKCTSETGGVGAAYCTAQGVPCPTEATTPFECGAYVCDPAFGACRTSCSASDACAPGYVCNVQSKVCEAVATVAEDSGCAISSPGARRSATSLAVLAAALGLVRRIRARRPGIRPRA